MPVSEVAEEMATTKSKKVIAITQGVAITTVILSLLLTSFATIIILLSQDRAGSKILDCVIPGGLCYETKIAINNQSNTADIMTIVTYCSNKNPDDLIKLKACVKEGLAQR